MPTEYGSSNKNRQKEKGDVRCVTDTDQESRVGSNNDWEREGDERDKKFDENMKLDEKAWDGKNSQGRSRHRSWGTCLRRSKSIEYCCCTHINDGNSCKVCVCCQKFKNSEERERKCQNERRRMKVKFADSLGLDLEQVKIFDEYDIFQNKGCEKNDNKSHLLITTLNTNVGVKCHKATKLIPLFDQPATQIDFLDRVRREKVVLENAYLDSSDVKTVRGLVRVHNLEFHKSVFIRWTIDNWRTMCDYKASYVLNSSHGFTDKFEFKIFCPLYFVGHRMQFCVRYHCVGKQFWDNNHGLNYQFVVVREDEMKS